MNWLGIDVETTGLDFEKDRIIELAAVLWDCERRTPLQIVSEFVVVADRPGISEEITKLTGITEYDVTSKGIFFKDVWTKVQNLLVDQADFIVAHNAPFDSGMIHAQLKRYDMPKPNRPWIDTMTDVPFPSGVTTRALPYLAAEHGFINPFPHRALFDVLTMLKVMSFYNANEITTLAKSPNVTVQAVVSFDEREKAKARNYRWNPEKKVWTKTMKDFQVPQEIAEAGFRCVIRE